MRTAEDRSIPSKQSVHAWNSVPQDAIIPAHSRTEFKTKIQTRTDLIIWIGVSDRAGDKHIIVQSSRAFSSVASLCPAVPGGSPALCPGRCLGPPGALHCVPKRRPLVSGVCATASGQGQAGTQGGGVCVAAHAGKKGNGAGGCGAG